MATITFTAKRSLISGHTDGDEVTFEIALRSANRSPRRMTKEAKSLSGRRITRLMHRENQRNFQTPPFNDSALKAQLIEFLDSVAAGESWTLDIYGTEAAPDDPRGYIIQGDYSETLVDITGFWQFGWQAVEV